MTDLAPEDSAAFTLSVEDETALLAAIAESEHGDVIDAEQVLRDLD